MALRGLGTRICSFADLYTICYTLVSIVSHPYYASELTDRKKFNNTLGANEKCPDFEHDKYSFLDRDSPLFQWLVKYLKHRRVDLTLTLTDSFLAKYHEPICLTLKVKKLLHLSRSHSQQQLR
jgi:hypothetical protein